MTSIHATFQEPYPNSKHVLVRVFAGPDAEHRASLGTLHATWEEAEELCRRINQPERPFPQTPEEARECVHGIQVWNGHECGECLDLGLFIWADEVPK